MALVERYHSSQEHKGSIAHESLEADLKETSSSKGNKQGISLVHSEERAKHVGILALEVYFPNTYVRPILKPSLHIDSFHFSSSAVPLARPDHNRTLKWATLLPSGEIFKALCGVQVSQEDLEAYD